MVVVEGGAMRITYWRYQIQAAQETSCRVRIAKGAVLLDVVAAIERLGIRSLGYEPARMTCEFFESLKPRLPMKASMIPAGGWVEELRMVKSPAELALIRRSVETNSRAFEQTVARVKPGMREQALATGLEYRT